VIVRTGTDFGSLDDDLLKHNLALVDRPQFDGLGVGVAVRSGCHGWNSRGFFIDSVAGLKGIIKRRSKVGVCYKRCGWGEILGYGI